MSVAACAEIVARGDPDRFLTAMSAPVAARAVLLPIYAFNVEVARAPWVAAEPMIGEMRLQWWRDVLGEIGSGAPPRAHEVVAPLAEAAGAAPVPLDLLDLLAEAHRAMLDRRPFEAEADLDAYLEATGAGLMWATARALGAGPSLEAPVRALGWASGLAAYLRAVPDLEGRGRQPLPDGRPEAVRAWAERGRARLVDARGPVPRGARPALWPGWRARGALAQAAADPGRVAAGALGESEFARRAGLLRRVLLGGW